MITPLPFQGDIIWGSQWTETVVKDTFEAGSYVVEQTRGANPTYWKGSVDWALEKEQVAELRTLFRSKPIGLFTLDHEDLGPIVVRRVGGMSFSEVYEEELRVVSVEFRTVD